METDPETTAWLENEQGERIPVRGLCTFGRTSDNTVVLLAPKASRRHAMIHEQGGEYWAVDLGSTNGIEINGDRVTHPARLQAGDRIQMPAASFVFRLADQATAAEGWGGEAQDIHNQMTMPDLRMAQCWMLLADLQGFTKMSQQLPAEELAPLVGKWMGHCQETLRTHKGALAKFLGDGFLALWTDRNDAAALVAAACRDFQALQASAGLPFRIIVHHGEISFGGRSPDASSAVLGAELNFAFRLEKVASRLKLLWLFSDAAASRLEGHLPLLACGPQSIPDFPDRPCFTLET